MIVVVSVAYASVNYCYSLCEAYIGGLVLPVKSQSQVKTPKLCHCNCIDAS